MQTKTKYTSTMIAHAPLIAFLIVNSPAMLSPSQQSKPTPLAQSVHEAPSVAPDKTSTTQWQKC